MIIREIPPRQIDPDKLKALENRVNELTEQLRLATELIDLRGDVYHWSNQPELIRQAFIDFNAKRLKSAFDKQMEKLEK